MSARRKGRPKLRWLETVLQGLEEKGYETARKWRKLRNGTC